MENSNKSLKELYSEIPKNKHQLEIYLKNKVDNIIETDIKDVYISGNVKFDLSVWPAIVSIK